MRSPNIAKLLAPETFKNNLQDQTKKDVLKMRKRQLTSVGATALSVELRRTVKVEHPGASLSCETEPGTQTKVSVRRLGPGYSCCSCDSDLCLGISNTLNHPKITARHFVTLKVDEREHPTCSEDADVSDFPLWREEAAALPLTL